MTTTTGFEARLKNAREASQTLRSAIATVIVGQDEVVDQVLWALARRRSRAARGQSRAWARPARAHAGELPRPALLAHPVHARPDAERHHRHQRAGDGRGRTAPAALRARTGPDLRQHGAGRRDQPRHAEDAERAARGDAGARGDRSRARATRSRSRSSCSPPRTRSRWRAPTRCPKPSSIASCSRCWSRTRAKT